MQGIVEYAKVQKTGPLNLVLKTRSKNPLQVYAMINERKVIK